MVTDRKGGFIISENNVIISDKISSNYFYNALLFPITLRPMNYKDSVVSYVSPIIYIIFLSFFNTSIYSLYRYIYESNRNNNEICRLLALHSLWDYHYMLQKSNFIILFIACFLLFSFTYVLTAFIVSHLDAKIMKFKYSPQQFGMIASSFTLSIGLTISRILYEYFWDTKTSLRWIMPIITTVIMQYYIQISYSESIKHESRETALLGSIVIIIYCILFEIIHSSLFYLALKLAKDDSLGLDDFSKGLEFMIKNRNFR